MTTQSPGSCQGGTGEILCYTDRSKLSTSLDDSLGPIIQTRQRFWLKNLVDLSMSAFHARRSRLVSPRGGEIGVAEVIVKGNPTSIYFVAARSNRSAIVYVDALLSGYEEFGDGLCL